MVAVVAIAVAVGPEPGLVASRSKRNDALMRWEQTPWLFPSYNNLRAQKLNQACLWARRRNAKLKLTMSSCQQNCREITQQTVQGLMKPPPTTI